MKIAIISYPMLFQRAGGLQVQVRETLSALKALDIDARFFDFNFDKLADYDVIHIFGTGSGNHAIVAAAKDVGRPVVLSPILTLPWSRWDALKAKYCDRVVGRLTSWNVRTTYHQMVGAISMADRLLAMGDAEKTAIIDCFGGSPSSIDIVPNGITEDFFNATPDEFIRKYAPTRPFVLCVASISAYKNQLGLINALKGLDLDIVLIGPCDRANRGYLEECKHSGGINVRYIGALEHSDPLLASAFAAAEMTALVSAGEASPISATESLATGTPVVLTRLNGLQLEHDTAVWQEVDPFSPTEIRGSVVEFLTNKPSNHSCRCLVKEKRWPIVAEIIKGHYQDLIGINPIKSVIKSHIS